MSIEQEIIAGIIKIEGGYTDHASDLGGATNYGITEAVARKNGYEGDMRDLPLELAYSIYKKDYWDVNRLSEIELISPSIAKEVADTGVNMGVKVAAKFLQRSLNALNLKGKIYKDLATDGIIGSMTIKALELYLAHRGNQGELVLLRMLNCLQGARYIEITEAREANEDFIFGWFLNRVVI